MNATVRSVAGIAVAACLVAACGAAATPTPPPTDAPTAPPVAEATQAPTPAPTPAPEATATPWPSSPGTGDQHIVGTVTGTLTKQYTQTPGPNGITQIRGGEVAGTVTANDARISGRIDAEFNLDVYTTVGSEWITTTITNEQGTWTGPCLGGSWNDGNASLVSCWLTGTGAYEGWTLYYQHGSTGTDGEIEGILYQGSPPTP